MQKSTAIQRQIQFSPNAKQSSSTSKWRKQSIGSSPIFD